MTIPSAPASPTSLEPIKTLKELLVLEVDELTRLRDEVRLKVHLAGMEGRSAWLALEKHLARLEERFGYRGDHIAETTRQIAAEVRGAARDFRKRLFSEKRPDPIASERAGSDPALRRARRAQRGKNDEKRGVIPQ